MANEFLVSRGLRVPEPELMRSAFDEEDEKKEIKIHISYKEKKEIHETYYFQNTNILYSEWNFHTDLILGYEFHLSEMYLSSSSDENQYHYENSQYCSMLKNSIEFKDFIIYSPENTALRTFQKEGQIQPLGINGEGLLKLL
ncbi:MAG TPA: chromosome segregation protein SMC, partial [Thiotrichaceae bacterium]|nr:chromosome segregation protein SMC [Thiotrichaceae bacterium]